MSLTSIAISSAQLTLLASILNENEANEENDLKKYEVVLSFTLLTGSLSYLLFCGINWFIAGILVSITSKKLSKKIPKKWINQIEKILFFMMDCIFLINLIFLIYFIIKLI